MRGTGEKIIAAAVKFILNPHYNPTERWQLAGAAHSACGEAASESPSAGSAASARSSSTAHPPRADCRKPGCEAPACGHPLIWHGAMGEVWHTEHAVMQGGWHGAASDGVWACSMHGSTARYMLIRISDRVKTARYMSVNHMTVTMQCFGFPLSPHSGSGTRRRRIC